MVASYTLYTKQKTKQTNIIKFKTKYKIVCFFFRISFSRQNKYYISNAVYQYLKHNSQIPVHQKVVETFPTIQLDFIQFDAIISLAFLSDSTNKTTEL